MSAHSPGPWTIEPGTASNVLDADGQYIAGVVCKFADGEPDTTDARLIEAAPELLALAERQLAWIEKALAAFEGESDPSEIEGKNIAAESAALLLRIQKP